ncbi:MAG TPA: flagellar hook-associated protein FlgK, partial [Gammaproteobacteria bacterium]|nr:flagellar hook-associated protein FlgK [Gammaproteobacteria bacterium]
SLVDVQVVEQSNFAINIYIGNGQSLVTDAESQQLSVMPNPYDSSQMDIGYANGSSLVNVTSLLTGGRLGGLIEQRTGIIAPSENSLGRIAVALADTFNRQHRLGMDLGSALGGDFFAVGAPEVLASSNNISSASISATITDPNLLSNSDYRLSYDGSAYTLVRLSDGQGEGPFTGMPFTSADGFSVDVAGGPPAAGDSYLIRPARGMARSLELLIDDTAKIAAAAPVRVGSDLANSGNGRVALTAVSDTSGAEFSSSPGALTPPLLVEFDPVTPNQYRIYDNSNPGAPVLIAGPASYDPATGMDVVADNGLGYGYELRIEGEPGLGDRFTAEYNSQGTGDNSNMLALAELQTSNSMLKGTASFLDAYAGIITDVGTRTYQADVANRAQQALLRQAVDAREAVSGVNLDEEAANMMRFQQAYQASAQVISAAQGMFDALLGAVRR